MKKILILLCFTFKVFALDINPGISGSWFDENNSGQGFNIEILSGNRILVYWYAYDQGSPIWLTGVGTYQGNNASISLEQFDGSNFGVNHQSGLVNSTPFGSLALTFQNCNLGVADYTSNSGFGSGSIPLNRLTSIPGLECIDDNSQPSSTPIDSIEVQNIKIDLLGCSRSERNEVTCNMNLISLEGIDQTIELTSTGFLATSTQGSLLFDDLGNTYTARVATLGNIEKERGGVELLLVAGVPVSAKLKFENISPNSSSISLFKPEFKLPNTSYFQVDFRNIQF